MLTNERVPACVYDNGGAIVPFPLLPGKRPRHKNNNNDGASKLFLIALGAQKHPLDASMNRRSSLGEILKKIKKKIASRMFAL